MLPGPVFTFEMMTASRRPRFYSLRALYAIVLLLVLWTIYTSWKSAMDGDLPARLVPWFGVSAFAGLVIGQEVLVLALTPALVSGAIAEEKRRKTLHYLLASQLTASEIVLGKLLVRMLYAGVLLGVSLPVMSLLVLLGGVGPELVLLGCGGLFGTAWFLATLSIWVSTIARRPREAMFVAYGLEALWLVLPPILKYRVHTGWFPIDEAAYQVGEWVGASSPVAAFTQMFFSLVAGRGVGFGEPLLWMIGLQAGAGIVLAALAAVQLRPIFRRQDGAVARPGGLRSWLSARRLRAHPPVDHRPMLWKELHTGGARGFARVVGALLTLILGGLLVYYGARYALKAFQEVWEWGYLNPTTYGHRLRFHLFLVETAPFLYLIGVVTIAGSAAASIASEHEDDTWVSLTATDLTGPEIILSKIRGALWRARRLAAVLLLFLVVGIASGAVHLVSLPLLIVALSVYGWFAAALGAWVSIQLRSTWRAQFLTIALLLLVNVAGQCALNVLAARGFAPQVWPGFTPYEVTKLVIDHRGMERLWHASWPSLWDLRYADTGAGWMAVFSVASLFAYATLAALLTADALRRFEDVAGRARRKPIGAATPAVADPRPDLSGEAGLLSPNS